MSVSRKKNGWSAKLAKPLHFKNGPKLETLADRQRHTEFGSWCEQQIAANSAPRLPCEGLSTAPIAASSVSSP
jgi:hypothetical protein